MPNLTYNAKPHYKKIGQLFDCSEGCVAGIAKKANMKLHRAAAQDSSPEEAM